jgi:TIGR03009 family protein
MSNSLLRKVSSLVSLACALAVCPAWSQEPGIRPRVPQQRPAAPNAPQAPREPFQLTAQELQRMDLILAAWERESDKVKLFKCAFTRWDYDFTWGPKQNDFLMSERHGTIAYRAPDNGTFKETEMKTYDAAKDKYVESKEALEHWVCDGNAIYQFQPKITTLEVTELPPAMRGKAITEGPLPFLFGAKAATLKQRYWIRETTPQEQKGKQVWLEAWPKFREQAANFKRVEVILGASDLMPVGMQVYTPAGKDRTAYLFENRKVNDRVGDLIKLDFLPPMTPLGWKRVVNPYTPPTAEKPEAGKLRQAERPQSNALR